jgi:hypothetical protein
MDPRVVARQINTRSKILQGYSLLMYAKIGHVGRRPLPAFSSWIQMHGRKLAGFYSSTPVPIHEVTEVQSMGGICLKSWVRSSIKVGTQARRPDSLAVGFCSFLSLCPRCVLAPPFPQMSSVALTFSHQTL